MKHRIHIDGSERVLDIRAMDERFIVYGKMFSPPLTPQNMPRAEAGPNVGYVIQEFFRKQIQTIGSCMILAWDGDGVIGKMHFTTKEMHEAMGGCVDYGGCYCVDDGERFSGKIQSFTDEQVQRLLGSLSRTLRVVCFNVGHSDERYHGQGIATAMLAHLKSWGRARGWVRMEAHSWPDITPPTVHGDWMLRRGAMERRGFRVLEVLSAPPQDARQRVQVIEDLLAGRRDVREQGEWYARNFKRLAAEPSWRSQCDEDYTMACDL